MTAKVNLVCFQVKLIKSVSGVVQEASQGPNGVMPPGLMPSSSTSSKLGMPGTEASLASEASTSGGPESSRLKLEAKTSSDLETDSGGSDEVKVYGDEDESEAAPSAGPDSHSSVDILSDLKSRLITESEQVG